MTVADNTSRNQYTATSGQTVFAYTFEIVDKDDIVVLKNGTTLSEGTDYTVSSVGNDSGGNVTLTTGATTGDILTLYRDMPYARTQNYTNSGDFLASEVNSDFDNLWLAGEQTNRSFSQSIRKPITDADSITMELPEASSRASKLLSFDASGNVGTTSSDIANVTASSTELNILDGATLSTAELNKLDGFTGTVDDLNYAKDLRASGVTAAEFDKIDGLTADATELNILDGATLTTAELNTLDGITASTAELNIMDGVTATTAELNILDGVTATATELNILDGVTATTAELNYVDGVTSGIQAQIDGKAALAGANFTGAVDVDAALSAQSVTFGDSNTFTVTSIGKVTANNYVSATSFRVGASEVIDTSSNLTNIGTISSGAITSSSTITATTTLNAQDGLFSGYVDVNGLVNGFMYRVDDTTVIDSSRNATFAGLTVDTDTLYVDATNDRIGIGTTSPAAELHIQADSPEIRFTDNDTVTNAGKITYLDGRLVIQSDDDNQLGSSTIEFQVDGSEVMRLTADGKLGIGALNPSAKLQITDGTYTKFIITDASATPDAPFSISSGANSVVLENNNNGNLTAEAVVLRQNDSSIALRTDGAERARLDSSGNLLVGKTTNAAGDVGVIARPAGQILATSDDNYAGVFSRYTSAGELIRFRSGGTTVGSISITSSATTYNTSSDQRLKENIVDAPSASDDIDAIQVRSFDWKADGSHQKYGMVAQELQTVAPDAVTEGETEEDMMSVDYSKLVPMLVKEIQSLRARVAQLETN